MTTTLASVSSGMPRAWGWTPSWSGAPTTLSFQPWKWKWKRTSVLRPVEARAGGGLLHLRVVVAQQQGAVPHHVVDDFVAVHVPLAGPLGALDVEGEGDEVADVVGDAVG